MTMRVVKVQGGLGNQLFCLAFAHSAAHLTGEEVGLDIGGFAADRYGHDFELAPLAARLGLVIAPPGLIGRRLGAAVARVLGGWRVIGDRTLPKDRARLTALARRGRLFAGYWQDEAWFADPDPFIAAARLFLRDRAPGAPAHALVVHYRSYADELRAARGATPDARYFRAAYAKIIADQDPVGDIVLISDRPDLAAARIGGAFVPARVQKSDKYGDLATLMNARALILTNSSFSWWGGYLSNAKVIVYPRRDQLFHYAQPAAKFEVV